VLQGHGVASKEFGVLRGIEVELRQGSVGVEV
jgi:hypothetical protein